VVRALKEVIEKAGLTVWFDFDRIGAGDTFDPKIQSNIRRCSLFLPVLSRGTEARTAGFFFAANGDARSTAILTSTRARRS
jgi:hypothetical protein